MCIFHIFNADICVHTLNRQTIPCNWHIDKPCSNTFRHIKKKVSVLSAPTQKLGQNSKVGTVQNSHVTLFWAVPLLSRETGALGTINGAAGLLVSFAAVLIMARTPPQLTSAEPSETFHSIIPFYI